MALDAPFYLAIGDCIVEPGDGSAAYHVTSMSFPEPAPDGAGGHRPAVRVVTLRVEATTAAALSTAVAVLRREAVRDNTLSFKPTLAGDTLTCRIREASVVEADFNPLRRSVAPFVARLTLTVETDPYWLGPWTSAAYTPSLVVPGYFDTDPIEGEVDALVRLRLVGGNNAKLIAIGVKPDPTAGYDFIDDYSGVNDNNAFGYQKQASSALTPTLADVGTTPAIDTNANRGRHLVIARLDSNATSAATVTYRAVQRVSGNNLAVSTDVAERAVVAPSTDLVGVELGDVMIPSGRVPDTATDTGYAAAAITDQQTTEDADTGAGVAYQTVTLTAGDKVTSVIFKTGTLTTAGTAQCAIWPSADGVAVTTGAALASSGQVAIAASNTEYTWTFNWIVPATGVYAIQVADVGSTAVKWRKNTAGGYAGGDELSATNEVVTGDDLYFKVYCATPLGFSSYTIVQAADSADASKVANLDYVQRIPVDFAAIIYRLNDYSAAPALFWDGSTSTPYIADADGIAHAIYDKCEIRGRGLAFRAGVVNRVVVGSTQADEAVAQNVQVECWWCPRYLTATG